MVWDKLFLHHVKKSIIYPFMGVINVNQEDKIEFREVLTDSSTMTTFVPNSIFFQENDYKSESSGWGKIYI